MKAHINTSSKSKGLAVCKPRLQKGQFTRRPNATLPIFEKHCPQTKLLQLGQITLSVSTISLAQITHPFVAVAVASESRACEVVAAEVTEVSSEVEPIGARTLLLQEGVEEVDAAGIPASGKWNSCSTIPR